MPHKLLLADDSVTIQRVIELTFADEDVVVTAVGDGKQAIERIQADPPDIVLADVGMPEKDGYEVADFVKRDPRLAHIPVLLLTGAFEPVDEGRAVRVGCDGVLAKPFEPQMVITRVRELLSANVASASRPTPRMIQPPPVLKTAPGPTEPEPRPVIELPAVVPPEPLPPPLPPPLSAGPTPVVPLPVVPRPIAPPERPAVPPAPTPPAVQDLPRREVEVRLPRGERPEEPTPVEPPAFVVPVTPDAPTPLEASAHAASEPVEPAAADPDVDLKLRPPIAEAFVAALPEASSAGEAVPGDDRSPEEVAVESAIDAAIRIRRRPPVAVPEIGVPPRALTLEAESSPVAAPAAKLDDYFDRLGARLETAAQAREMRPPTERAPISVETGDTPEPADEPQRPTVSPPSVDVVPDLPPLPTAAAPRAVPEPASASSAGLAQAFSALLDAERGQPGGGPIPSLFAPPSISPALREELVEQVTRLVLERLSDRVVRETVTDLVSRVTERLVREEIERLKTTIK